MIGGRQARRRDERFGRGFTLLAIVAVDILCWILIGRLLISLLP